MDKFDRYFEINLTEPHPMKVLTGCRGSGKTYRMFEYAQKNNYPIFATTENKKKSLQMYAENLGFNVKVICSKDITDEEKMRVCVDELEQSISEIEYKYNITIEMCTLFTTTRKRVTLC